MVKSIIASASAAIIAAGSAPAFAQPSTNTSVAKSVVLVHGAFADGSGWRGVYDELTERGYRVTIVQNPLTSLADDVAATLRALDRQDGATILVGHSWGGVVITEAGMHRIVQHPTSALRSVARGHRVQVEGRRHSGSGS